MDEELSLENLAAIGRVVTEWAKLEERICLSTASLIFGLPVIPGWLMTAGASPSYLLPRARAYLNLNLHKSERGYLERFDLLNEKISRAQTRRNSIAHGVWEQQPDGRMRTSPLRLRGKRFDFDILVVGADEMLSLAQHIQKLEGEVGDLFYRADDACDPEASIFRSVGIADDPDRPGDLNGRN